LRFLALTSGLGFILALIVVVGVIVHFGSEGSKIAMEHKHYKSVEELRSGERGWTVAGTIGLCLFAVFTVIGFAAMLGL
jgi:heme/copper-type cytochrome/quinol oxidase subunit 2